MIVQSMPLMRPRSPTAALRRRPRPRPRPCVRPDSSVFAASPGWLKGTNTAPAATPSVTRSGTTASPPSVTQADRRAVGQPVLRRVVRVHLRERLVLEGLLQVGRAVGQPALVDEQRVREQREVLGPLRRAGAGPGRRAVGRLPRGPQRRHLVVQLLQRVEAQVAAHGRRQPGEDLPVGPADPLGLPHRADPLAPALPVGDVAVALEEGRGRQEHVGVRLEVGELEGLHDQGRHVLERLPGERRVGHVAQRVDADQVEHVDLPLGAGPQDLDRRSRPRRRP